MEKIKWQDDNPFTDNGDTLVLSELMVLESAAGYYFGYLCKTIKCNTQDEAKGYKPGLIEPFERLSGYYSSHGEAKKAMLPDGYKERRYNQ